MAPVLFTLLIEVFVRSDSLKTKTKIISSGTRLCNLQLSVILYTGIDKPMFLVRYWVVLEWRGWRTRWLNRDQPRLLCSVLQWMLVSLQHTCSPCETRLSEARHSSHLSRVCQCSSALPPVCLFVSVTVIKTLTMIAEGLLTNTRIQCTPSKQTAMSTEAIFRFTVTYSRTLLLTTDWLAD